MIWEAGLVSSSIQGEGRVAYDSVVALGSFFLGILGVLDLYVWL